MSDIYLKQLQLGPMGNYTYLVGSESVKKCFAVDPAWDLNALDQCVKGSGFELIGIILTHCHPDHCGGNLWGHQVPGIAEMVRTQPLPVHIHEDEADHLLQITGIDAGLLEKHTDSDTISVGGVEIRLMHTPGHSPGGMCLLIDKHLIAGDTLFITACGRVDLPGGNPKLLYESLHGKLAKLADDTIVYPGHNYDGVPQATLAEVKRENPFMQVGSLAEWNRLFGGGL